VPCYACVLALRDNADAFCYRQRTVKAQRCLRCDHASSRCVPVSLVRDSSVAPADLVQMPDDLPNVDALTSNLIETAKRMVPGDVPSTRA
jgi:hypothetical protein